MKTAVYPRLPRFWPARLLSFTKRLVRRIARAALLPFLIAQNLST
ncbi:MAG TPA: hypothetical protein VF749_10185 [Candidatus Acidoferrum sp.]